MFKKLKTEAKGWKLRLKIIKNNTPVTSSTIGYCQDMLFLQYLHFLPKNKKLKTGNKSCHDSPCLQTGQIERPFKLFFCSNL